MLGMARLKRKIGDRCCPWVPNTEIIVNKYYPIYVICLILAVKKYEEKNSIILTKLWFQNKTSCFFSWNFKILYISG